MIPNKTFRIGFLAFTPIFGTLLFLFAFVIQPEQIYHEHIFRNRVGNRVERITEKSMAESAPHADSKANMESINVEKKGSLNSKEHDEVEKFEQHHSEVVEYEVNGTQTLLFVAEKYNVPASYICKELDIPQQYSSERLGQLRKRYGFSMSAVSKAISKYRNQNP